MLTDKNLISVKTGIMRPGRAQYLYRVGRYGLSVITAFNDRAEPDGWEIAPIIFLDDAGIRYQLSLGAFYTEDVEEFKTDKEANAFIEKAFECFERIKTDERDTTRAKIFEE